MIFHQLKDQLNLLTELLHTINNDQYTKKLSYLGDASIGGHTRHIIELLKCVVSGYVLGSVDYNNRIRNLSIELDKSTACDEIELLLGSIIQEDKKMELLTEEDHGMSSSKVITSYFREIVYNTEHTIHHLALIKVGLREMKLEIVDESFGMAYSTIKYKSTLTTK